MTGDEPLHWRSEPEWAPCVICQQLRPYLPNVSNRAPRRRRRWWDRPKPQIDESCPWCGAQ
jgi:hypothetical protein